MQLGQTESWMSDGRFWLAGGAGVAAVATFLVRRRPGEKERWSLWVERGSAGMGLCARRATRLLGCGGQPVYTGAAAEGAVGPGCERDAVV